MKRVDAARRIIIRRDGVKRKTRDVIFTYDSTTLPIAVNARYLQFSIRGYVPNAQQ